MTAEFRDGRVYDGKQLGYIKDDKIYRGSSQAGYVKDGKIYEGSRQVGYVKNGDVYNSSNRNVGKIKNYTIKGIERERDDMIVAVYHLLIKKFL